MYTEEYIKIEDRGYKTPCHVWQKSTTKNGYSRTKINGKKRVAHVVAWEAINGAVPPGLQLDHLCRIRPCTNPEHLELVTNKENFLRGNHPSAITIRTGMCKRGHKFDVDSVITRKDGRRQCRTCVLASKRQQRERKKAIENAIGKESNEKCF